MSERLRVLVIGSGGREHALAWSLSRSPSVDIVHVCPGNGGTANGALDESGKILNFDIAADEFTGLVSHAKKHGINLVVPGPEAVLVTGIRAYFHAVGIRCFGPSKAAARMEGSKSYAKKFMQRHRIPTAAFRSFSRYEEAKKYLESIAHDVVIKADGLAAGKGVIIPTSKEEAHEALKEIMVDRQFGVAGDEVVIEEFLQGEELSILTFSDGYTIRSLPPAQDHKRIFNGDKGPNTGGMGCYAPTRVATPELITQIQRSILQPTIDNMRREGYPFVGVLFTGLMITKSGPRVIEYNVRFGDPEIQTLLPLLSLETDLARVMVACTDHWLDGVELQVDPRHSATVVASAEGYPGSYAKHRAIKFESPPGKDVHIFHAGTAVENKKNLVTTGGRVIAVTATGATLEDALAKAYQGMNNIRFEGMHYRTDIAHHARSAESSSTLNEHLNDQETAESNHAPVSYASSGVSLSRAASLVSRIKSLVQSTARPGTAATIGGFGGVFDLSEAELGLPTTSPTIVGAIDGVGTKLKIAYIMDKHETVGIDLVAMNVNDLVVQGATPVMFLDCYTCGTLDVDIATAFVAGVAEGCKQADCALVGGETAEMPGLLQGKEYDAVGAAIGVVDTRGMTQHGPTGNDNPSLPSTKQPSSDAKAKRLLPDTSSMVEGDILLGLASSGCHSNGFSLIRKIIEANRLGYSDPAPWDPNVSIGHSLLTPTRIYIRSLRPLIQHNLIKGMAHITGGGLVENVPRILPRHLTAEIDVTTFDRPPVLQHLQRLGHVASEEMSRVFNNGVGMVIVVSKTAVEEVMRRLEEEGEKVWMIGRLILSKNSDVNMDVAQGQPSGIRGCVLKNLSAWDQT